MFRTLSPVVGISFAGVLLASSAHAATSFGVVSVYDPADGPGNAVDTNSSGNPLSSLALNDVAGFTAAVATAHAANTGGVINFGSATTGSSSVDSNQLAITYGGSKTFTITTAVGFAAGATITSTGVDIRNNLTTLTPISGFSALLPNQSQGVSSWSFDFGSISNGLVGEAVTTVGFTLLSRSGFSQTATIDWFLDGSTTAAFTDSEAIANSVAGDDTFVSYTAPTGSKITGFTINYGGSLSNNDRRIGIDDLGFITGVVVPEPGSLTLCGVAAGLVLSRRRRVVL